MAPAQLVLPPGAAAPPQSFTKEDPDGNDDYEYYDYDLYSHGPVQQQSRYQPLELQHYGDSMLRNDCVGASRNGHNYGVYPFPSRSHRGEEQMYQPVSSVVPHSRTGFLPTGARGSPTPESYDTYDNDILRIYPYSSALTIGSSPNFSSPIINDQDNDHYDRQHGHPHLRAPISVNCSEDVGGCDYDNLLETSCPPRRQTAPPPSFAAIRAYTPSTTTYTSVGRPIPPTLAAAQFQAAETQTQEDASSFYPSPSPSPAPSGTPSFIVHSRQPPSPPLDVPRLSRPNSSPSNPNKSKKSHSTFSAGLSSTIPSASFLDGAFGRDERSPHIPLISPPSSSVTRSSQRGAVASRSTPSLPAYRSRILPLTSVPPSDPNATGGAAANTEEDADDEEGDDDDNEKLPSWMTPLPYAPERSYWNERYASSSYQHPTSWKQKRISKEEKSERVRMLEAAFATHDPQSTPGRNHDLSGDVPSPPGPKWGREKGGQDRGTVVFRERGRRTRMAVRWSQFLCAWIAGVACFYAIVIIRPNPAAPVSKHWTTYASYLDAILSSLLSLHFFFLRRWKPFRVLGKALVTCCGCCGRAKTPKTRSRKAARDKRRYERRGKVGTFGYESDLSGEADREEMRGRRIQPVHVNVALDPRYITSAHPSLSGSALASAVALGTVPTTARSHPPGALFTAEGDPIPPTPHPHALFHPPSVLTFPSNIPSSSHPTSLPHLSRTAKRSIATDRRTLTRLLVLDAFFAVGWGVLVVLAFMLPTSLNCPPGKYGGWCNAYNITKAAGCGLALLSVVAFGLDVRDIAELGRVRKASSRL